MTIGTRASECRMRIEHPWLSSVHTAPLTAHPRLRGCARSTHLQGGASATCVHGRSSRWQDPTRKKSIGVWSEANAAPRARPGSTHAWPCVSSGGPVAAASPDPLAQPSRHPILELTQVELGPCAASHLGRDGRLPRRHRGARSARRAGKKRGQGDSLVSQGVGTGVLVGGRYSYMIYITTTHTPRAAADGCSLLAAVRGSTWQNGSVCWPLCEPNRPAGVFAGWPARRGCYAAPPTLSSQRGGPRDAPAVDGMWWPAPRRSLSRASCRLGKRW